MSQARKQINIASALPIHITTTTTTTTRSTTTFNVRPTAGVAGTEVDDFIRPANGVEVDAGAFAVPVTALLEHQPLGEEGTSRAW